MTFLHNEEGVSPDNYRYYRTSEFDPANNIHVNEFEIEKLDESNRSVERRYTEIHRQKIYTFEQMLTIVKKTGFRIAATYNGFTLKRADKKSLRITMVLQWKTTV